MSVPVSLRLCCIAAMAPALTEATGQPSIQIPGSPPPVATDSPSSTVNGGFPEGRNLKPSDIASVKVKIPGNLSSDLGSRGLLTPINHNGISKVYSLDSKSESLQKSLKDLGLTEILKHIAVAKQGALQNGDHQYQKIFEKKMNQPSNGNGPNGTGKKFIRQTSLVEEKALNGHANLNRQTEISAAKKPAYSRTITPPTVKSDRNNLVANQSIPDMCHSRETVLVAKPVASSNGTSSAGVKASTSHLGSSDPPVAMQLKDSSAKQTNSITEEPRVADLVKDASRKEFLLERRSQFILRRLRRLQGKQLESQVKSQLRYYVDYQHQNLQTVASKAIRPFGDLQSTLFSTSDVKNLSTSNLVSLVRKLQASKQKLTSERGSKKDDGKGVLVMEQSISSESDRKASHLRTSLRHWVDTVDTDATESSSGGESCEEWEDCPAMKDKQVPIPLYKRAEWKWSVDRAAIVSRWTWLQAQVSDLEYRIRQQSEIHKTIRTSKGVVTLCDPPNTSSIGRAGDMAGGFLRQQDMSPANVTTLMINVNKQASRLTQSLGNCLSPLQTPGSVSDKLKDPSSTKSLNGYLDGSHSNLTSTPQNPSSQQLILGRTSVNTPLPLGPSGDGVSVNVSPDLRPLDATCVAARCRPVRFYRKRKLLRTAGLHQVSHKAARLSSVKCQCYPPVMPCPMCGGRYNNVQRLDAEGMPIMEKVSLLDPAFHPVLSFPQEIALPIHFEALLKSGEWQSIKPQPKASMRAIAAEKRRQKLLSAQLKEQARKNRKNLTKTAAAVLLSSAKLRSKYDGRSPHKTPKKKVTAETRLRRKELKKRRAAQLAVAAFKKTTAAAHDTDQDTASTLSGTATPSPHLRDGHGGASSQKDGRKKRFEQNAYDINNIVIPYSMAAATRVEKLQYKEIQTPKWRMVSGETEAAEKEEAEEQQPMEVEDNAEDTDTEEDMTDDTFSRRHDASETEERKRFRSFVTYPPVRRSRLSRESESAGGIEVVSPDSSLNLTEGQLQQALGEQQQKPIAGSLREEGRRRSGSTSRRLSAMEEFCKESLSELQFRFDTEPWPRRQFPLPEDDYEEMKQEQLKCDTGLATRSYTRARAIKLQDDMAEFVNPDCERSESPILGRMSPAHSATSESTLEDMNDPEWREIRKERKGSQSGRHRKR